MRVHPSHIVDAEDVALINWWQAFQAGGMGVGPLPFTGGLADQPACVMRAFDIIGAAHAALKPEKPDE